MQKWEYKIQPVAKVVLKEFHATLDKLGDEGWELVMATPGEVIPGGQGFFFFYKRPMS